VSETIPLCSSFPYEPSTVRDRQRSWFSGECFYYTLLNILLLVSLAALDADESTDTASLRCATL
jgi:hypothetical protein